MPRKKQIKKRVMVTLVVIFTILLFVTITIITIFFTQGRQITPEGIVNTGSIRINIDPNNIDYIATIDDEVRKVQDRIIGNLEPGNYSLQISSPNYYEWQNEIIVRQGIVSEVYIKLFPKNINVEQITSTNIAGAFFSDNGEYAYYLVNDSKLPASERGIWRLRLSQGQFFINPSSEEPQLLIPFDNKLKKLSDDSAIKLLPNPENNRLLISNTDYSQIYLLNIGTGTGSSLTDISLQLGAKPTSVNWFDDGNSLVIRDKQLMYEYHLPTEVKTVIRYSPDQDYVFDINPARIYFLSNERIMVYEEEKPLPLELPATIDLPNNIDLIDFSKTNSEAIIGSGQNFYILDLENKLLEPITTPPDQQLTYIQISDIGTSLLFKNLEDTIYTLNLERLISAGTTIQKFNRTDMTAVNPVRFVSESDLILYHDKNSAELVVSAGNGSNKITLLKNFTDERSKYKFSQVGDSIIILNETEQEEGNRLLSNLFKIDFDINSSGFSL